MTWWLDLQQPVQSVLITTKPVSLNPAHGEVYSIQDYVIKFVSNLRNSVVFCGSPTNKTDRHNIAEILMKMALSITPLTLHSTCN